MFVHRAQLRVHKVAFSRCHVMSCHVMHQFNQFNLVKAANTTVMDEGLFFFLVMHGDGDGGSYLTK